MHEINTICLSQVNLICVHIDRISWFQIALLFGTVTLLVQQLGSLLFGIFENIACTLWTESVKLESTESMIQEHLGHLEQSPSFRLVAGRKDPKTPEEYWIT